MLIAKCYLSAEAHIDCIVEQNKNNVKQKTYAAVDATGISLQAEMLVDDNTLATLTLILSTSSVSTIVSSHSFSTSFYKKKFVS